MFNDFLLSGSWTRDPPIYAGLYVARNAEGETYIVRFANVGTIVCIDPVAYARSTAIWSRPLPVSVLPEIPAGMRHSREDDDTEE